MNRFETMLRIAKSMHLPLIFAGIAAISFSNLATTHVASGWFRGPVEDFDGMSVQPDLSGPSAIISFAPPGGEKPSRVQSSCGECGVVDSVRRVVRTQHAPPIYEITVRMRSGATRVVSVASEGNWRARDRITLIGGERPPAR